MLGWERSEFDWKEYLKEMNAEAAAEEAFTLVSHIIQCTHKSWGSISGKDMVIPSQTDGLESGYLFLWLVEKDNDQGSTTVEVNNTCGDTWDFIEDYRGILWC